MRRISFNPRFVNEAGDDLVVGKIHSIRQNFDYWKKFEGREVELFTWEGKPYQKGSKQKVFCVKPLILVQHIVKESDGIQPDCDFEFFLQKNAAYLEQLLNEELFKNDGFSGIDEFADWFRNYPDGEMAILHFTDFRY
jgi:hypothetical protein